MKISPNATRRIRKIIASLGYDPASLHISPVTGLVTARKGKDRQTVGASLDLLNAQATFTKRALGR